jgi:hypothetical protein
MIMFFKSCRNCTITFDGGRSKRNGLYTIRITTADCQSFCVEIDDASRLSHTANYVFEILSRVSLILSCDGLSLTNDLERCLHWA